MTPSARSPPTSTPRVTSPARGQPGDLPRSSAFWTGSGRRNHTALPPRPPGTGDPTGRRRRPSPGRLDGRKVCLKKLDYRHIRGSRIDRTRINAIPFLHPSKSKGTIHSSLVGATLDMIARGRVTNHCARGHRQLGRCIETLASRLGEKTIPVRGRDSPVLSRKAWTRNTRVRVRIAHYGSFFTEAAFFC